ncbi:MAG: hypothetical protein Kow00109_22550 [Acidobacteriota bacterium]
MARNKVDFWKRKLMAYLHDPPDKPLKIAGHQDRAEDYQRRGSLDVGDAVLDRAGLARPEFDAFYPSCDHTAAAADRFPFPKPGALVVEFAKAGAGRVAHPLGGSAWGLDVPTVQHAEGILQDCQPQPPLDWEEAERWWANFFLHWRRWPRAAAEKDPALLYLPADTRIPDHSVWTHMAVVSALQACVEETGGRSELRPAFLLFQLGPVQEFIAQARSTRDLWSGSFLLSWLMAHAMKAVADELGPDVIIFPSLRGQPIFDRLHRASLFDRMTFPGTKGREETLWERLGYEGQEGRELLLTPTLPNRFLAVVPERRGEELARAAEAAVRAELGGIAAACWAEFLGWKESLCRGEERLADQWEKNEQKWKSRFDAQVARWPQIAWQVVPWRPRDVERALASYERLTPGGKGAESLRRLHGLAVSGIPQDQRDPRYFSDADCSRLSNPGFAWPYYYAATDWALAARRQLRDFEAWKIDADQSGAVKDSLSGIEEVIGSEELWAALQRKRSWLFRSQDRLGAPNLVKRLWPAAYLEREKALPKKAVRSVPAVAAAEWHKRLAEQAKARPEVWEAILKVRNVLIKHRERLDGDDLTVSRKGQEVAWLLETDPDCFRLERIAELGAREDLEGAKAAAEEIQRTLQDLYGLKDRESGRKLVGPPPSYVAVLMLDGDEMGKWVGGENTPPFLEQLAPAAREYFEKLPESAAGGAEAPRRPLSPSYHLQFSEALANFSLYLVRPIVEHFGGLLVYSGGDDVLALLPATSALSCALALRAAFRGEKCLERLVPRRFEVLGDPGGWVRRVFSGGGVEEECRPGWPLVVPGPRAECSVGIAVGHIHAPLQNLVRAAREAEQRAKGELGRGACAVALYKRSGEILHWGFQWRACPPADDGGAAIPAASSEAVPAFRLFQKFCEFSREDLLVGREALLSGRFAYQLREFVQPYAPPVGRGRLLEDVQDFPIRDILLREVRYALDRHWSGREERNADRDEFLRLVEGYLGDLEERVRRQGREAGERRRQAAVSVAARLVEGLTGLFDTANFILREEEL